MSPDARVTAFLHVKIDVEDLDRSLAFYSGKLGMRQIVRYEQKDGVTIVQVSPTGQPPGIELWHEPPHPSSGTDRIHIAIAVHRLRDLLEDLRRGGVNIVTEPFAIGQEVIAFLRDPDGHLIELNESPSHEPRRS